MSRNDMWPEQGGLQDKDYLPVGTVVQHHRSRITGVVVATRSEAPYHYKVSFPNRTDWFKREVLRRTDTEQQPQATRYEVKPTFSDIVDLVSKQYRDGFNLEIGYAKAAALVDEAILGHVKSEALALLERLESQQSVLPLSCKHDSMECRCQRLYVIPLSAIQKEKERYL